MKALLLGDVCATRTTEKAFYNRDSAALFGEIASIFEKCDVKIVNLECALTERDCPIKKIGPSIKSPLQTADVLASIGVNYCNLSNNHSFDYGKKGIEDTKNALERVGIQWTGFGENEEDARKNLVIEQNGERIAIIAVSEHEYNYALPDRMGARAFDPYDTLDDIRAAKAEADRVIVLYHGGKEFSPMPSPRLHKLCHAMAKAGADVILTQHSHCIGCYEKFENCHILYGQGNFCFVRDPEIVPQDSSFDSWNSCLAVFYDTQTHEMEFRPIVCKKDASGLRFPSEEEEKQILSDFSKRSERLSDGKWIMDWKQFCIDIGSKYLKYAHCEHVTPKEKEIFAHFLDCEAHTDVWRELCQTMHLSNEI